MKECTSLLYSLPSFTVTHEAEISTRKQTSVITYRGKVGTPAPEQCPRCGWHTLHRHQTHRIRLKHMSIAEHLVMLDVEYQRYVCTRCGHLTSQRIPFKESGHRTSRFYAGQARWLLSGGTLTLSGCARIMHAHPSLIKDIDKKRLQRQYGDMKPTHDSRYIGVDEFSLHKGHRYATVVIDLQTGEVLFLEEGNRKEQFIHFFQKAGDEWMRHVKAVAMDMNAQYDAAVRERYPHISIVYDPFHIVKLYNDKVLTMVRREEQNRLRDAMEKAKKHHERETYREMKQNYDYLKGSRFHLLSNMSTLTAKDKAAREHNRYLSETYESKGLPLPPGENKRSVQNVRKLKTVLDSNEKLQMAYFLGEQLKLSLKCPDSTEMHKGLLQWIDIARATKDEHLISYARTVEKHLPGILSHAVHPISNGRLEGTNTMIKTTRRAAYGYRDMKYFFLKIWENSRRYPKTLSHRKTS